MIKTRDGVCVSTACRPSTLFSHPTSGPNYNRNTTVADPAADRGQHDKHLSLYT